MAKNKRKALSAIDRNIGKCHALNSKPLKSNRVKSKARASDVFEPRGKSGIPYVSVFPFQRVPRLQSIQKRLTFFVEYYAGTDY